jgi:hypothetical protein
MQEDDLKQIDLEPRSHSSNYELKPMSRWWLAVPVAAILLNAYLNGFSSLYTWGLVFFGMLLMAFLVLIFPHYWLSRRD